MSPQTSTEVSIRQVTDEEIQHIYDHGWTFIPNLISPDLAAEILEAGKELMGADYTGREKDAGLGGYSRHENKYFANFYRPGLSDPLFASVVLAPQMGKNAALLLGRDMGIRYHSDLLAVKLPKDMNTDLAGKDITMYHQDVHIVRSTAVSFWISLVENTPEMGTMRYYDKSHKLGELHQPMDEWPRLQNLGFSEPLTYGPGDATAHVNLAVHGAPENNSDKPRWAYITAYLPKDAPFLGIPSIYTDEFVAAGEIEAGKPLDHPAFPVVYDPEG